MDQLTDFADSRLINDCIYCGGAPDTREHVPSRTFLDKPYPNNLPVVGCCDECNKSFSKDEQYVVCLIESILAGSTDPEKIRRAAVGRTMRRAPALRARIESAIRQHDDCVEFAVEEDRLRNIMLKLAKGHAVYELREVFKKEPSHFWCGALSSVTNEELESFEASHFQEMFGEVGCRNLQRLVVMQLQLEAENGSPMSMGLLMNDWIEVQEGNYRYMAISEAGGVSIRIVIAEYLGCEIIWRV